MNVESTIEALPDTEASLAVDALLDEIAELAKSAIPASQFYQTVLDRIVPALSAVGGAVWTVGGAPSPVLRCETGLDKVQLVRGSPLRGRHDEMLCELSRYDEPLVVAPINQSNDRPAAKNPTDYLIVLWTAARTPETTTVVEIFQRPTVSQQAQQAYLRFFAAVAELFEDFHRNERLRSLEQDGAFWSQFESFLRRLHADQKLPATAYLAANDGRRLLGCDRLTVARFNKACRILAVSNIDAINRRSSQIRLLENLATRVARVNEPLWWSGSTSDLPPELENALHAYLDQSNVRTIALIPLPVGDSESQRSSRPVGVLVMEQFAATTAPSIRHRLDPVARQTALALENALKRGRRGFLGIKSLFAWFSSTSRLLKLLLVLLLVGSVATALTVVETDFTIEARGALQPLERRDVFAPSDGVVQQVLVKHGQHVEADTPVAVLRDPELDLELKRVFGELQTNRQRLKAIETQKITGAASSNDRLQQFTKISGEAEELKQSLDNLQRRYELLTACHEELTARSPIAGQVTTWDLHKLLLTRPVTKGQVLMSVANTDGPWILELDVPDDDVFHVLAARRSTEELLAVEFTLATDPGTLYHGTLRDMGVVAEARDREQPRTVTATVDVVMDLASQPTPGATTVAKIQCGRRPVGYVWFRDLIEAVHTMWVF